MNGVKVSQQGVGTRGLLVSVAFHAFMGAMFISWVTDLDLSVWQAMMIGGAAAGSLLATIVTVLGLIGLIASKNVPD